MANVFGPDSLRELRGVHPVMVQLATRALALCQQDFGVHDGLRTIEEQREYVRTGVSRTMNSMHMKQPDGFGWAVDLVPFINGKLRWEWPAIYPIVAAMRQALDALNRDRAAAGKPPVHVRWGGAWDKELAQIPATAAGVKQAMEAYVARRKAMRKSAFTDGPHFELMGSTKP